MAVHISNLLHSESVTHVISENNCGAEVRTWLDSQVRGGTPAHLLDISWYTESMKAGHPVEILDRHKLQVHLFIYFTGIVTTALLSLRHTVNKHYVLCVKTLN